MPAVPGAHQEPSVDLTRLAPDLGGTCHEYLCRYRESFAKRVREGAKGVEAAREFSRVLDGLLGALFCAADAANRLDAGSSPGRVALVAVGGYGRGIVGLESDIDVLFLCDDPSDPRVGQLAEGILYPLWDLGFDIGHAVRGVGETLALAREDIRTATTLIDLRRVGGDAGIVEELLRGGRRQVFEPHLDEFLDLLLEDTAKRHERFGGSLYLLEPEVKQGRGGLRDLDVAEWAARARWDARTTEDYVRTGALLAREVEELEEAREMLWRVRNLLHLRSGRAQDRLTFADQEEIAEELGFVDGVVLGVEQFMQAYYRHARTVWQTAERMIARARPSRRKTRAAMRDLGDGTAVFDGHITLVDSDRLAEDPALALRLYRQVARKKLPPYPFARDAIARIAVDESFRESLRASEEATQLFVELLTSLAPPLRRTTLLEELHEIGLTVAMIPEIEPLTGRVTHDVYHVYTADVHAVRAVDRLRALFAGERLPLLGLPARLAALAPRRTPLIVATFLHILGRVHGGHRPERGAAMAKPIAERMGLSAVDVAHVLWLIEEQSRFHHWATRRDTSDPVTLSELAGRVGSLERARDLYLLTVAVLSTTNPTALTSWKARTLEDLYLGLASVLGPGGDDEAPNVGGRAQALREEIRVGFVGDAEQTSLEGFLDAMPDRYVLANPADVVRRHARLVRDHAGDPVFIATGPGPSEELTEVVVRVPDRAGLLADVAAALTGRGIAVVDAQVYTYVLEGSRYALDVFLVRRAKRTLSGGASSEPPEPVGARALEGFCADLRALFAGDVTADALVEKAPEVPTWAQRRSPEVPTEITVDNAASRAFTVVDVFTRDRVGVLHAITRTMLRERISIALAKINTEGERVADVFYVTDAKDGQKLRNPERLQSLRDALVEALGGLAPDPGDHSR